MCGIFCLSLDAGAALDASSLTQLTRKMLLTAERRGREAAGVCVYNAGQTTYIKQPTSASQMVRAPVFSDFCAKSFAPTPSLGTAAHGLTIIGHARLVTNGMRAFHANNQPFEAEGFVGVHNGIIVNYADFFADAPQLPELDSLAIAKQLRRHAGADPITANQRALADLRGVVSYLLIETANGRVHAGSNNGSLYEAQVLAHGAPVGRLLMSEMEMLRQMQRSLADCGLHLSQEFRRYDPGTVDSWRTDRAALEPTHVRDLSAVADPFTAELTRCTTCLLPHTMPFIDFDEKGECNWCRNKLLTPLKPRKDLDTQLAVLHKISNRPNCLIAISGGRTAAMACTWQRLNWA